MASKLSPCGLNRRGTAWRFWRKPSKQLLWKLSSPSLTMCHHPMGTSHWSLMTSLSPWRAMLWRLSRRLWQSNKLKQKHRYAPPTSSNCSFSPFLALCDENDHSLISRLLNSQPLNRECYLQPFEKHMIQFQIGITTGCDYTSGCLKLFMFCGQLLPWPDNIVYLAVDQCWSATERLKICCHTALWRTPFLAPAWRLL